MATQTATPDTRYVNICECGCSIKRSKAGVWTHFINGRRSCTEAAAALRKSR